jgi:hypothetical protein
MVAWVIPSEQADKKTKKTAMKKILKELHNEEQHGKGISLPGRQRPQWDVSLRVHHHSLLDNSSSSTPMHSTPNNTYSALQATITDQKRYALSESERDFRTRRRESAHTALTTKYVEIFDNHLFVEHNNNTNSRCLGFRENSEECGGSICSSSSPCRPADRPLKEPVGVLPLPDLQEFIKYLQRKYGVHAKDSPWSHREPSEASMCCSDVQPFETPKAAAVETPPPEDPEKSALHATLASQVECLSAEVCSLRGQQERVKRGAWLSIFLSTTAAKPKSAALY